MYNYAMTAQKQAVEYKHFVLRHCGTYMHTGTHSA
jgi:hypothetical protein